MSVTSAPGASSQSMSRCNAASQDIIDSILKSGKPGVFREQYGALFLVADRKAAGRMTQDEYAAFHHILKRTVEATGQWHRILVVRDHWC